VTRVLALGALAYLAAAPPAYGKIFDDRRQGLVVGFGAGLAAVALESGSLEPEISDSGTGFGLGITLGLGLTSRDVLAFHARGVGFSLGEWNSGHDLYFRGGVWNHFFGARGRSFMASVGVGSMELQTSDYSCGCLCLFPPCPPCPNPCPPVTPPEGDGVGYMLGIGYELNHLLQITGYGFMGTIDDFSSGEWTVRQFGVELQLARY